MRARDDQGVELNAEYTVTAEDGQLGLVLESAGGQQVGSTRARNDEYVPALRLLLHRLRQRRAVLKSVVVVSRPQAGRPQSERTLSIPPVTLAEVTDVDALRLEITRAQGKIGKPDTAIKDGNNRKRIRLNLTVPGYTAADADRLAADLAHPAAEDAEKVLRDMHHATIETVTGQPNTVLGIGNSDVLVATERSPEGKRVSIADVQHGLDLLARHGSVRIDVPTLGHRSAFVGAVLAALPHTRVTEPAMVHRDEPPAADVAENPYFGETDGITVVKVRREQRALRTMLAGGRSTADCALCGEHFPWSSCGPRTSRSGPCARRTNVATCSTSPCSPVGSAAMRCSRRAG